MVRRKLLLPGTFPRNAYLAHTVLAQGRCSWGQNRINPILQNICILLLLARTGRNGGCGRKYFISFILYIYLVVGGCIPI